MAQDREHPVAALLGRLERWLGQHRRKFLKSLPPGATPKELDELQGCLGIPLPVELRSLLAWHNGQGEDFIGRFEGDWLLMSCRNIAATWNDLLQDPAAGWNKKWIPFLDNDAGDFLFLDTSRQGSPLRYFCLGEKDQATAAPSLAEWLREFVDNVERGNYAEDPERGTFPRKHGT
jgi:cell wall assembly regulator SMI1